MRQWLNPANLFSLARLALAPLAAAAVVDHHFRRGLALFALAGLTDAVDGMLARRFRWQTRVGAYLDPIADKVLLVSIYLCLGLAGLLPWWLVTIVFGRDALILAYGGVAILFSRRRDFSVSLWGKISTTAQMLTAISAMGARALPSATLEQSTELLIPTAAAATLWSGVHYGWQAWKTLRVSSTAPSD